MTEDQAYRQAKRQVHHLKHFYHHLMTYGVIIVFLHIINLLTSSYYWAIWPMLGWGVFLALHAMKMFGFGDLFGPEWEERQIQKIMAKRAAASEPKST